MTSYPLRRPVFAFIAALTFSFVISGQASRPDFNRARTYDVQHYIIRVNFDRGAKRVNGDTTVQLKPLAAGFSQAQLDAANLRFETVALDPSGKALKFRTQGDKVIVTLDRAYNTDELISIRFKYSATPKKGIYFQDEARGPNNELLPAQIWTQGEPEEARHWFPSYDAPNDKATSESIITANKGETVIGNGELLEQKDNPDGTVTFHYKMPVPYSTYLTSFVVGKYVRVADTHKDIPLGFYVYPGSESIVPLAFANTRKMMQAFEELTGVPFPYNKYDQTIVRNFHFGGMENITATTLADTEVFFARFEFGKAVVEDLVSHELAHSWFGDLVTNKNWNELWLNESFATFMEAASREKLYGRDSYIRKIRSDAEQAVAFEATTKQPHGLFNIYAKTDESLFDTTTYQKGGVVLHMLRETIGDAAFWKGVNIYLNRHKFDNVETPDLLRAMEEASGKDLDPFFEQWVYGAGVPKLDVKQEFNASTNTLKLTVAQTQKAEKGIRDVFVMPMMNVEIKTAGGAKTEKLDITKRVETFTYKLDGPVTAVRLDPDDRFPIKTLRMNAAGAAKAAAPGR